MRERAKRRKKERRNSPLNLSTTTNNNNWKKKAPSSTARLSPPCSSHPLAWALAPGVRGLTGSLVTLLLMLLVARQGSSEADAAGDAGDAADISARTVRVVSAVATATPIAWGLAAAALRLASPTSLLLPLEGAAIVAWGWWRVVSHARDRMPDDGDGDGEQRQQRQQGHQHQYPRPPPGFAGWGQWQWWQQQQQRSRGRQCIHHLPGKAPSGASGDVARILRARNYFEVLGFETKSSSSSSASPVSLPALDDEAVKASWRRLVKSVHLDRQRIRSRSHENGSGNGGGPSSSPSSCTVGAEEAFNLVAEAFESLKDAGARARYARALGVG